MPRVTKEGGQLGCIFFVVIGLGAFLGLDAAWQWIALLVVVVFGASSIK